MYKLYKQMANVLNDIENGLKEGINLDALAEKYDFSEGYLRRIFKHLFKQTLGEYIRLRKLSASLDDLLNTDLNVLDIALKYNFEFEQSYIRSFKREFGLTPGEYRKTGQVIKIAAPIFYIDKNRYPDKEIKENETYLLPSLYAVGKTTNGNVMLPDSPYGYEIWTEKSNTNKFIWYGAEKKGGAAFRAEWNNAENFSARVGYFLKAEKSYKDYRNIYCDFIFNRSVDETATKEIYIGAYSWTKNPMIEWFIVEDWFFNSNGFCNKLNIISEEQVGEYYVDDAKYYLYKYIRLGNPGNESITPYIQYISVRQTKRQKGRISITKHFEEWEKMGMPSASEIIEAKFCVVASGKSTGWFDAKHISLYQEG